MNLGPAWQVDWPGWPSCYVEFMDGSSVMVSLGKSQLPRLPLARLRPAARTLTEIVLLVCLATLAARLVWLLVDPFGSVGHMARPDAAPGGHTSPAALAQAPDLDILRRINPFAPIGRAPLFDALDEAPETSLDLKLIGTRATTEPEGSTAIIVMPDNRQGVFLIGDEVLRGVEVRRILVNRVILERNGQLESLVQGVDAPGTLTVIGDDAPRQVVDGAEIIEPVRVRLTDPQSLFGALQLSPQGGEDGLEGYRVGAGRDRDALAASGLVEGDLIVLLDGQGLDRVSLESLARRLAAGGTFSMTVRREDRLVQIDYEFEGE